MLRFYEAIEAIPRKPTRDVAALLLHTAVTLSNKSMDAMRKQQPAQHQKQQAGCGRAAG